MRYSGIILVSLILLWCYSGLNLENFPTHHEVDAATLLEPLKGEATEVAFELERGVLRWEVEPIAEYSISGVVVSAVTSTRSARDWETAIINREIGLMWGENAVRGAFRDFDFNNERGELQFLTDDVEALEKLEIAEMANLRVIASQEDLQDRLQQIRRGDQVRLFGLLSHLSRQGERIRTRPHDAESRRAAVSVLYLQNVEVLHAPSLIWRRLHQFSGWGILGTAAVSLLIGFIRLGEESAPEPAEIDLSGPILNTPPEKTEEPEGEDAVPPDPDSSER